MALQAIAAFFVPLSLDERREMHRAAHHARSTAAVPTPQPRDVNDGDAAASSSGRDFTPLRAGLPLAFVSAHPLCRVTAEASSEGVQVGHTHYERPEQPEIPSAPFVWDISPPPTPALTVHVTRFPLRTSGLAEGLWWLRHRQQALTVNSSFQRCLTAFVNFSALRPVQGIRIVLEKESPPHQRRPPHSSGGALPDETSKAAAAVHGAKECPLSEEDLSLVDEAGEVVGAATRVSFTSLEVQQLCFLPAALRLLPCLFGTQLSTVLFTRCTCVFDATLRDEQRCGYARLSSKAGTGDEVVLGVRLPHRSSAVELPYGAANLLHLSANACGSEAFWSCIAKFFLCPQCVDETLSSTAAASALRLTPLAVLDLSDNKGLSTRQLHGVLQAVKQRNTVVVPAPPGSLAPPLPSTELVSLRELNTSFTYAIRGIQWGRDFAGLGCHLTRLALARCDVDGATVTDILCAGESDVPRATVSVSDEPFSAAVRRLLLLDVRWNLRVDTATVEGLRDNHAMHCKHLRVAGSAIGWEAGHRFATTVTP